MKQQSIFIPLANAAAALQVSRSTIPKIQKLARRGEFVKEPRRIGHRIILDPFSIAILRITVLGFFDNRVFPTLQRVLTKLQTDTVLIPSAIR